MRLGGEVGEMGNCTIFFVFLCYFYVFSPLDVPKKGLISMNSGRIKHGNDTQTRNTNNCSGTFPEPREKLTKKCSY